MVKEPKITIKLFLQDRLKPMISDKGEESFSLYARIIFLRRGTQLPILAPSGQQIYMSRPNFEFLMDVQQRWVKEGRCDFSSWERIIFSKELLLHKTIEKIYAISGEKIDFKEVVSVYRWYEQFVHIISHQKALEINEKLIGGIQEAPFDFSEDHRRIMETLVAVSSYTRYTTYQQTWSKTKEGIVGMPSSTFGTIYHWIFEGGKRQFKEYLLKNMEDTLNFNSSANGWGVSWEFIKLFPPQKEYIDEYGKIIDSIIFELEPKKMLYQY